MTANEPVKNHVILGVHITDRVKNALEVQKVLTEFGCSIKTRLGLHEVNERFCGPNGLLLLELTGDDATVAAMEGKLAAVPGLEVKKMIFTHP